MSRVAKNPINVPDNVELNIVDNIVKVKGSKGELEFNIPSWIDNPKLRLFFLKIYLIFFLFLKSFFNLIEVLKKPFNKNSRYNNYAKAPSKEERVYQTFCGT